jgi:glycoside/pentoside/hexuronide:cation symporter, GPH family
MAEQRNSPANTRALAAYGSVAAPLAILVVPLYNYLPTFYASEMHLNLSLIGALFFASRIWDSVLDPLIGVLSDRTQFRWGRRKPWILAASPALIALTYLICVPPAHAGYVYLLTVLFAFYVAWSCLQIPHLAWGAELAQTYLGRNRVVAIREAFFMCGILAAVLLPVLLFGTGQLVLRPILQLYSTMALILIPITAFAAAWFAPDYPSPHKESRYFFRGMLSLFRGREAFSRLLIAYGLMQLGLTVYDSVVLFLVSRVLGLEHLFLLFASLQFIVTIVSMPMMTRIGRRVDKHRLLAVFTILFPVGTLILSMTPRGNAISATVAYVVIGLSVAPYRVMPTSMVADCADLDYLRSGIDRRGTHMAILMFFFKLALAAGVGVAFPLLDAIGFNSTGANDPGTLDHLRVIVAVVPALLMLPAFGCLWNYPLTRAAQIDLRKRLDEASPAPFR